jgi:4a-hydroxytetrahydrobiopterin dehydratase
MPYATPLTEPEIAAALASLPEWRRDGDWLIRTVVCPTFRASIALVAAVADAAEEADHHPDIEISWRRVTFRLTTKAARALTAKDVAMAATINRLASITA